MYRQQPAQRGLHPAAVLRLCEHRQHGRVPVVAVDDLGREIEVRDRVEHGAGEEGVLLALGLTAAVDLIAEVKLAVDEINAHVVEHEALYAAVLRAPAEVYIKIEHMLDALCVSVLYAAVVGRDDPCVEAELFKRLRQRPDNVGKAAGL